MIRWTLRAGAIVLLAVGGLGCRASPRDPRWLASDYPLDRVRAAVALAEAGDARAVPRLVDLLADDDRGVRLYSILALERLTGQTYDYVYYAPQPQRDAAVERWRTALRNGEVTVRSMPDEPREPSPRTTPSRGRDADRLETHTDRRRVETAA